MNFSRLSLCLFVFAAVFTETKAQSKLPGVIKIELTSNWEFSEAGADNSYPAAVPGCIHTDLLNNKLIPDPFFGTNESDLQWIGKKDWIYRTTFDASPSLLKEDQVQLVFKGLDTYAEVFLNDSLILSADNMFREWKVPVKGLLKLSGNTLEVLFKNVFEVNLPKWQKAPFRLIAFPNNDQSDTMIAMYSRKAQFHYGWDWGPRLITCGIWREVYLEGWDEFKLDNVQVIQKDVSKENADIVSVLNITADKNLDAKVTASVDGKEIAEKEVSLNPGSNKVDLSFMLENPNLWWTNGLGTQYLYGFRYEVTSSDGSSDSLAYKIGIRSLKVIRQKDALGESFYVKLNGVPVFMKGADYIPQDNFQNRVTVGRYEHMIKSAAEAHMNILRVWGGGIYENDEFYDLCDQYGILVWQEFMFACAMYPADSSFLDNVRHEVIDNVTRIRNHPSLALYCGNNENEISWYQWGWKNNYSADVQKQYGNDLYKLFHETIPRTLEEVDTTRYYHYSSPSAGFNNIPYSDGDIHYWGVWHGKEPFEDFDKNIARFVSEYGFQSYPELSTIKKFAEPQDMQLHSEVMLSHQRCMADDRRDKEYGNRLIQAYLERQYRQPKDFTSYVYVSQVLQAEGVKVAIEAHRRSMPYCMGSMYWQIDDCWPVASWSSIDYYGNWKALHYYAEREYRTFLISAVQNDGDLSFYVVSDSLADVPAELDLRVVDFNGRQIYSKSIPTTVKADTSCVYATINEDELTANADKSDIILIEQLQAGGKILAENTYIFEDLKNLELEKPDIKISAEADPDGYELKLTADRYAKNVYLSIDNASGSFTDNYFDLIPGRTKEVRFQTNQNVEDFLNRLKVISLVDSY